MYYMHSHQYYSTIHVIILDVLVVRYLKALLKYVVDDAMDKQKFVINPDEWTLEAAIDSVPDLPQQQNGVDCGMFTIMFADFLSDDLPLSKFDQCDILGYRRKVVARILNGSLDYDHL